MLLPGFEWISWSSFGLGLIESYGWYFALIRVPLYNFFLCGSGCIPGQCGSKHQAK